MLQKILSFFLKVSLSHVHVFSLLLLFENFSHQLTLMGFHWNLSDSKSPQVSKTLLSILTDLNNGIVWIVSTRPFISKSSSPFINPLVTVPKIPIMIGINVTFMFHIFFNSLVRSKYLFFFSLSFNFTLWLAGIAKSTILQVLFVFVVDYLKVWPRLSDPFGRQNH